MDTMLADTAVRKLKARNRKEITLVKNYFEQLTKLAANCLNTLGSYSPARTELKQLRGGYEPLYKWVATQLTDIYGFPVEYELLSRVKFTEIDLIEGVIELEVKHTLNRVTRSFTLRCNDEAAPYSTNYADKLTKVGGQGHIFAQHLGCV